MARTPRKPPARTDGLRTIELGDPPAAGPYPAKPAGRAVPDHVRAPDIGAACTDMRKHVPTPVVRPETAAPVSINPEDAVWTAHLVDKQRAYDKARREGRYGAKAPADGTARRRAA